MNTLAWVLIVVSVFLLGMTCWNFWLQKKLWDEREESATTIGELMQRDQVQAYHELEKGMDEQQEGYEQDYLQWAEDRTALAKVVAALLEDVRFLLGLVYDFEEVTLLGEGVPERVKKIHVRQSRL